MRLCMIKPLIFGLLTMMAPQSFAEPSLGSEITESRPTTLFANTVLMPPGASTFGISINPPRNLGMISVLYTPSRECPRFALNIETATPGFPLTLAQIVGGRFAPKTQPISYIKLNLLQEYPYNLACHVMITYENSPTPSPVPTHRTLIGQIGFTGGFAHDLKLNFDQVVHSNQIEIYTPKYCQNVEILDATILSADEQVTHLDRDSDGDWTTLKVDRSTAISGINLSIAGAEGAHCTLPVYMRAANLTQRVGNTNAIPMVTP